MKIIDVNSKYLDLNPHCPHGPTVEYTRFYKGELETFFACSAFLNKGGGCPFFFSEKYSTITPNVRSEWDKQIVASKVKPKQDPRKKYEVFQKAKLLPEEDRLYCNNCCKFVSRDGFCTDNKHVIISNIPLEIIEQPSSFLKRLDIKNQKPAFWFTDKTVEFIKKAIETFEVEGVLCFGTPSIHDAVRASIPSLLLDMDARFCQFYGRDEFCWFNMCNFYFMDEIPNQDILDKALKPSKLCVVLEPPPTVRLELIARTLTILSNKTEADIFVILILPFNRNEEAAKFLPDLEMLDYIIKYSGSSSRVDTLRIFTDADHGQLTLPKDEGYWFCKECDEWKSPNNKHCVPCGTCTSKSGTPHNHCYSCNRCVDSIFIHCVRCNKCTFPHHICSNAKGEKVEINHALKKRKGKIENKEENENIQNRRDEIIEVSKGQNIHWRLQKRINALNRHHDKIINTQKAPKTPPSKRRRKKHVIRPKAKKN